MDEAVVIKLAQERAIDFINSQFGEDVESLSKGKELQSKLLEKHNNLKSELRSVTSEVPGQLERSVRDTETLSQSIERVRQHCKLVVDDVAPHISSASPLYEFLSELTDQIKELEHVAQYFLCISQFEDLSSDIQSALLIDASERAVAQFVFMTQMARDIKQSNCRNLVQFSSKTVTFWNKILKDKIGCEFDECLRAWQWPFIVSSIRVAPINNASEVKAKLSRLFTLLANLHVADQLIEDKTLSTDVLSSLPPIRPILLPVQYLIKPFQRRFLFHFYGNQKTNNREKPEWFYTQILSWIRDHREFLTTRIQPALDSSSVSHCDVLIEFSRGLVMLAIEKLISDLPDWLEDEALFAHLVDETLSFHRELRDVYAYLDTLPSCLHVIMDDKPFHLWIEIEKKFALEKMDTMLSSSTAWKPQYKDIVDVDDLKISECGEAFVTLLHTITDRYKLLPSVSHRFEFVQLQLDLLDDFRIRLVQLRKQLLSDTEDNPLQQQYYSILNTVSYISDILQRWTDQPFFIKLQYYKQKSEMTRPRRRSLNESSAAAAESGHAHRSQDLPDADSQEMKGSVFSTQSPDDSDEAGKEDVNGSLFDEIISLLDRMRADMLRDITSYVFDDVKARSRSYRRDKWLSVPSHKDLTSLTLSNSACPMLRVLKTHLYDVEQLLCQAVFSDFWQAITVLLNEFIYKEVILRNHFSEGGAAQLQFDMTRNFFPMFAAYTSKPENYFKDVKEACIVLALSSGSSMLLKDVLYRALHEPQSHHKAQVTDPVAALQDIGIFKLSFEEVELLLSHRVDVTS